MTEQSGAVAVATAFDGTLEEVRKRIEAVLRNLPEGSAEARGVVARELEIDPRPEELQGIFRIAQDSVADVELRDLAVTALALRVLSERSVRELFESADLSPAAIGRSARLVAGLLGTTDKLEAEVQARVERIAGAERDYLLEVVDALLPAVEPLIAGMIVAPYLLSIADDAAKGDPRAALPALSEDELTLLREACAPRPGPDQGVGRIAVNAFALRVAIEDDLTSWQRLAGLAGVDGATRRAELAVRLKRNRTAYRYVSGRLQQRQDAALVAGLQSCAERLRRVQRDLFSTYLKLAPVLNASTSSAGRSADTGAAADLDRLLRACQDGDQRVEEERVEAATKAELCAKALRSVTGEEAGARPRIDPRRLRALVGVAAGLLVVTAVVWGQRLSREPLDLDVAPQELGVGGLELIGATAVGPMLHAQISHFTWADLSETERRKGMEELGLSALARGHVSVYLTDENGRELAVWTQLRGAELRSAPAPEPAG